MGSSKNAQKALTMSVGVFLISGLAVGYREAVEDGVRVLGARYKQVYVYNCAICGREVRVVRYPTKEEKGARLGYTLISNQSFVDGNKRIGMYVMLTFLEVNGIRMACTNQDVIDAGMGIADGSMKYAGLFEWVRAHKE